VVVVGPQRIFCSFLSIVSGISVSLGYHHKPCSQMPVFTVHTSYGSTTQCQLWLSPYYLIVKTIVHSNFVIAKPLTLCFPMYCLQKPAFAGRSTTDELSAFLQQCKEVPVLDMFSSENSMNITAAMVKS